MEGKQVEKKFDANVKEVLDCFENVERCRHRGNYVPDRWTANCPSCG